MYTSQELTHRYSFNQLDHSLNLPIKTIDSPTYTDIIEDSLQLKKTYKEYQSGLKLLTEINLIHSTTSYYSNYPLEEVSPSNYQVVFPSA